MDKVQSKNGKKSKATDGKKKRIAVRENHRKVTESTKKSVNEESIVEENVTTIETKSPERASTIEFIEEGTIQAEHKPTQESEVETVMDEHSPTQQEKSEDSSKRASKTKKNEKNKRVVKQRNRNEPPNK